MSILQRYLARLFVLRWSLIACGFAVLVLLLDLMANSDSVIESSESHLPALLRYMVLRLPIIFERIFPFSILLAALLTLIELTVRRELVAMMAAGASQLNLLLAFVPVAVILAAVQFVVGDQLSPRATAALKEWGVGRYGSGPGESGARPFWLREGSQIIRIGSAPRSGELVDVTIFRRNPDGNLSEKLNAGRAIFDDGVWRLSDVRGYRIDMTEETRTREMAWRVSFTPSAILALAANPRELTLRELTRFSRRSDFGSHPTYVYEVWRQRKFAQPVAVLVIFLLTVPLVQRFQRRSGAPLIVCIGVTGGFVFFSFEGLLVSMGTAGLLPPVMAAWTATAIFGLVGLTMAAHREML